MADFNKDVENLQDELGALRSIASDVGKSLREAFNAPDVADFKKEVLSTLSAFNKVDKTLGDTAVALDKALKKEISRKDLAKEITKLSTLESKILADINKVRQANNVTTQAEIALQNELLSQLQDQLSSVQQQRQEVENVTKSYKGQFNIKKVGEELKKKFRIDEIKDTFTLAGLIKLIVDAALRFNEVSVNISKNLGYGADNADRVTQNLTQIANNSSNLNVTLKSAAAAMNELNSATGGTAEYSANALETQIMLTKQLGLSGEEAAGIYKFSLLTGKSSEKVNDEMLAAFANTRNALKGSANFKESIAAAAKVSGRLAVNLQNNPALITKAVVQAQAFGTTLEQINKQGDDLLNWESSIEKELKAELLTGKQLNLERARAAALAGDQVALAEELQKNVGTLEDFQKMNVLQQKSLAEAMGLSVDELSDQLRKQKMAQEQGKSLAQLNAEELKAAEKRQNVQDKFNAAIEKLQDFIGNLVAGPFGTMLDILTQALDIVFLILKPFQLLYNFTSWISEKLFGWVPALGVVGKILKGIAGAAILFAAYSAFGALAGIPIVGPILGGIAAAAITAAGFGLLNTKTADDMIQPGYGKRTIVSPEGSIALNDKDTIVAGTNLGGGGGINLTPMINAINAVKASVDKLYTKDTTISMDSKQVGTTLTQNTPKLA